LIDALKMDKNGGFPSFFVCLPEDIPQEIQVFVA
jgi:hypothetical protein